jgi:hypothetical protein
VTIVVICLATASTYGDRATAEGSGSSSVENTGGQNDAVEVTTFRPIITASPDPAFAVDEDSRPVKVKIFPMYNKLPRGGKCLVAVELEIKSGWHINANPSHPDFLVPTKVEVKTEQKVKLSKVKYPEYHDLHVKDVAEPYRVYDGKVIVYGLLEIDKEEADEFAELEFHVNFQGCNTDQCLPPDRIVMKGRLPLAADGEELQKINDSKFPKPKEARSPSAADSDPLPSKS